MSKKQPHKYVDIANLDVERINCFYGSECRLSDVQEWLDELPVVEGLEKVTHCSECVYAEIDNNGRYHCKNSNNFHQASYFCADGLSANNVPRWKTIYNEPGNDKEEAKLQCPYCKNIYQHPYPKCPACHNFLKIPDIKER